MRVLVIRGRRISLLLLAQEKSIGLLLCEGFRDWAATPRAKVRISHPKMRGTSWLLASLAKSEFPMPLAWTLETRLPSEARIPEL